MDQFLADLQGWRGIVEIAVLILVVIPGIAKYGIAFWRRDPAGPEKWFWWGGPTKTERDEMKRLERDMLAQRSRMDSYNVSRSDDAKANELTLLADDATKLSNHAKGS